MFFKDSVHTLIIRVFGYLFALAVQVLIANKLGASAKGELQIVMFVFAILTLLVGMGFERSIIYFLGTKKYGHREIWANSCTFLAGASVLGFVVLMPALKLFQPFLGEIRFELLVLSFLIVPVDRFFSFQLGILNGFGQIRRGNVYSFIHSLFFALLVGLFLYWLMPSCEGIIYAHVLAYVIAIGFVIYLWRKDIGLSVAFAFNKGMIVEFFKYGSKGQIGNITNRLASRVDLLMLNYFLGKASAGVYSVAINFVDVLLFLPFIFAYIIFPHTSRREQEQGWALTEQVTRISFFGTIVVAIGLAIFSPLLIKLLFDAEFWSAYKPLWILLPGVVLFSAFRIMASGISGLGYPFVYSFCTIFTAAIALGLNILWVQKYQHIGAAWASSIAYAASFVILMLVVKFKYKRPLKAFLIITKADIVLAWNHIVQFFGKRGRN